LDMFRGRFKTGRARIIPNGFLTRAGWNAIAVHSNKSS